MNARTEFIEHTHQKIILCAKISYNDYDALLKVGYNQSKLAEFLAALDFDYDESYGSQRLYGTIWYEDGTWSDRGEYDGSEWWEYNNCPEIPEELL